MCPLFHTVIINIHLNMKRERYLGIMVMQTCIYLTQQKIYSIKISKFPLFFRHWKGKIGAGQTKY